jgi:hypothetical protein
VRSEQIAGREEQRTEIIQQKADSREEKEDRSASD